MSTIVTAAHIPLFDRIAGFAEASFDGKLMDASGLRQSLQRDLSRLFNVRNGLTIDDYLASEGSVFQYGLPDLLTLSPQSDMDLEKLEAVVLHGITLYEPRLSHVGVKASREAGRNMSARVIIEAAVAVGKQLCRVDFDVLMDSQAVQFQGAS